LKTEYSIDEILNISVNGSLGKKVFLIKNEVKKYSNRLHWFSSSRIFTDIDPFQEKVAFACKICKVTIQCRFPHFTNLSHHLALDDHGQFRKWKSLQPKIGGTAISDEVFALIKFLVSSYSSLSQIKNQYLHEILKPEIREKISSFKDFRYKILPEVFDILKNEINRRLNRATTISLVVDIWTNCIMADYLGLAAVLSYELGHRDVLIIGFGRMQGYHDSVNIKKMVEELVNVYDFNKKKIACKLTFTLKVWFGLINLYSVFLSCGM